jgi:hypothetical protein
MAPHHDPGMTPRRVQLSRAKGWRMPPNTVKVDRTTRWGNPFLPGRDGTQADCVEAYGWLAGEPADVVRMSRMTVPPGGLAATVKVLSELVADPEILRGLNLACWCALDEPCHADVLLRVANRGPRPGDSERLVAQESTALETGQEVLLVATSHLAAARALHQVAEQHGRVEGGVRGHEDGRRELCPAIQAADGDAQRLGVRIGLGHRLSPGTVGAASECTSDAPNVRANRVPTARDSL